MSTPDGAPASWHIARWSHALRTLMEFPETGEPATATLFTIGLVPVRSAEIERLACETGRTVVHVVFGSKVSIPPRDIVVAVPTERGVTCETACRPYGKSPSAKLALLCGDRLRQVGADGRLITLPAPPEKKRMPGLAPAMRRWATLAADFEGIPHHLADAPPVIDLGRWLASASGTGWLSTPTNA